jgi:hypothetical protein
MRTTSRKAKNPGPAEWRSIFSSKAQQYSSSKTMSRDFRLTLFAGELRLIDGNWYVTHAGLMYISIRRSRWDILKGEA